MRLRLTPAELDALREAAARAGLTPSGYAADAAVAAASGLEAPSLAPWREALGELMLLRGQLRRIGSNLNQASRALNVDGKSPIWLERLCVLVERNVAQVDNTTEAVSRLAGREVRSARSTNPAIAAQPPPHRISAAAPKRPKHP